MSNTKYPDHHHNVVYKNLNHHHHRRRYNLNQRDDSDDEIDVFEAAKYFAVGASDHIQQKSVLNYYKRNEDDQPAVGRRSRISSHRQTQAKDKQEPVSPGGRRLVSFLISLFKQTSKSSPANTKDEDQTRHHDLGYAGRRRKRRSSISHFPSFNNNSSSKIISTGTGFRTPPPPSSTKTNMYQRTPKLVFPDNLSKHSGRGSSVSLRDQKMMINGDDMETMDLDRDDDGGESDSSSDLFELQNYDLCSEYCSVSGVTSLS